MSSTLGFQCNPSVEGSSAPPIPLAALWSAKYTSTPDKPLINLSQGVPGAPPPVELQTRLADAAADPSTTGYGPIVGDLVLRQALAKDLRRVYGTEHVTEENVNVTAGCNMAFYATILALCQKGDEVILPSPWYFNHEMTLTQLGVTIVPLPCRAPDFLPSVDECKALITPRTRALILVSPNNPTGALYPPSLIAQFADLARSASLPLLLDETYADFVPSSASPRPHDLFASPDWGAHLVRLSSMSKSYAIPGHRLGYITASPAFLTQMQKTLDCLQICPARPAQVAVAWAVEGVRAWREGVRDELEARQARFRELLEGVEGWEVMVGSAYFAWVRHPFVGVGSEEVARRLGEEVGLVVLPGSFFCPPFENVEDDRFIRFSVANVDSATLEKVPARLEALDALWSHQ